MVASTSLRRAPAEAGFTLIEMMVTMAITLIIMGGTMAAMSNAMRSSETARLMTGMNAGLRTAADIMVRDMLQVGQGLPSGRTIDIPAGAGSTEVIIPGAPLTPPVTRTMPKTWDSSTGTWKQAEEMTAIIPGPGAGPTINGVATDTITVLEADGAFLSTISDYDVNLTALDTTSMSVDPSVDISNGGADDLHAGDLIMLQKATSTTLVQVTSTDGVQKVFFASGDSLNLNQTTGATGTLKQHVGTLPSCASPPTLPALCTSEAKTGSFVPSTATRVRMIVYYIDNVTDPTRPRLVRRINNGDPTTYDNLKYGTAVAFDIENLQISYDLVDGVTNPANVKMTSADLGGTGRCAPNACSPNNIRKVNISLTGRSRTPMKQTRQFFRNTITTQVSLRSMSFIDRYK
jgi:prepilin-type N-terminal cleavage/methylation domain-containing protein